jgi:glycosyltransferase involved in cell wall biosynthesis
MLRRVREPLDILALDPWLGGSHAVFLESWASKSRHRVRIQGLKARHWRWRMRAGAWELARSLAEEEPPELLFVSDYVDLPSLYGFLPAAWASVPALLYFHENQLTYPGQEGAPEPDFHLGFTNILSCLRADAVAFNSAWHRDEFRSAAIELLSKLPKPNPRSALLERLDSASVISPGVDTDLIPLGSGGTGPLRVAFNHRWEHDKDPRAFLFACSEAIKAGSELELLLLGERFASSPDGLEGLLKVLAPNIVHEGYAPDRETYAELLGSADLVASTALHEFFGMAVAEGLAAGCAPLVPNRLSYPEVLGPELAEGLYEEGQLASRLTLFASEPAALRERSQRERMRRRACEWSAAETCLRLDELADRLQSRT